MKIETTATGSDKAEIDLFAEQRRRDEAYATMQMNKEKNITCKNGKFSFTLRKGEEHETRFKVSNTGCNNPRRNGSAFCEDCARIFNS